MGEPALKDDPRYVSHAARGQNQAELDDHIAAWTRTQALDDLLARLEAKGVPCGRVFRAPDMLTDPQYQARGSITTVEHPVFGPIRMQDAHPKLSETPGGVRWPGPALGEHTAAVLAEKLGVSERRLAEMKAAGVV
jgi:formyl-CoA transferase